MNQLHIETEITNRGGMLKMRPPVEDERRDIISGAKLEGVDSIGDVADNVGRFTCYSYGHTSEEHLSNEGLKAAKALAGSRIKVFINGDRYRTPGREPQRLGGTLLRQVSLVFSSQS